MGPIPRRIFLLGPDEWDEGVSRAATPRVVPYLSDPEAPLTPHALRLALQTAIERELGGWCLGVVMRRDRRLPEEDDAGFFRRLEVSEGVDAYFLVLPSQAKVLGTIFEGGMLQRDFHYGLRPRIVLFLEQGMATADRAGHWTFLSKGKRTRYLESVATRAEHVAVWPDFDDLLDQVLRWAQVDD